MSQPLESTSPSRISGFDPFATQELPPEGAVENAWFDAQASSRRASVIPPSVQSARPSAVPIGDTDADAWFR